MAVSKLKPSSTAGFSRLAPVYDLAGDVFSLGAVRRAQSALIRDLAAVRRVLIVGGGTGIPLEQLALIRPCPQISFVEPAPGMLNRARRRAHRLGLDVDFLACTLRDAELRANFDLLCTPFFLDLFGRQELGLVMQKLDACLAAEGMWLEADYRNLPSGVLGATARIKISALYRIFGFLCKIDATELPDTAAVFHAKNYTLEGRRQFLGGLIETRLYRKVSLCSV